MLAAVGRNWQKLDLGRGWQSLTEASRQLRSLTFPHLGRAGIVYEPFVANTIFLFVVRPSRARLCVCMVGSDDMVLQYLEALT